MDELVQFLRGRLHEDEQAAQAAGHARVAPTPWRGESWDDAVLDGDGLVDARGNGIAVVKGERVRDHIVRHDPARVLRDIEAKRRLVEEFAQAGSVPDTPERRADRHWQGDFGYLQGLARAVHLLASVYADHPDYREEWAP